MEHTKQPTQQSVGQRIRALRLENNLTQDQFAHRIGVSRSAIAQWETDRAGQGRENLKRIAKILGTSLAYLVSGGDGPLEGDECALMRLYRACAPEDRQTLLATAKRLKARTEHGVLKPSAQSRGRPPVTKSIVGPKKAESS